MIGDATMHLFDVGQLFFTGILLHDRKKYALLEPDVFIQGSLQIEE